MTGEGRVNALCVRCGRACDGCPLCCCEHPGHRLQWEPQGCPACNRRRIAEEGRRLASRREDLIAQDVDPSELLIPLYPTPPGDTTATDEAAR